MKYPITIKLVLRSWKRNRIFTVISILSLAIGITCANLLIMFVIHEYNIEAGNPVKDRILYMSQDSPMKSGEKISYVARDVPALIKEKYGEVEEVVRFQSESNNFCMLNNIRYAPLNLVSTDTSFPLFFSYNVLYGNLNEALEAPDKLALSEATAKKLFGKANALGKIIIINTQNKGNCRYQVAAVLKDKVQSFVKFDALTRNTEDFYGGTCLILMRYKTDTEAFAAKVKKDKIPTLQMDKGRYYFDTLQKAYFSEYTKQSLSYLNNRQPVLLYVGFASALLILLIACFNYINLNFSRILQQVKMIHTEKLMGATHRHIRKQLFADTFFTVFLSFLLSILLLYDLLPVFNSIVTAQLAASFFYNLQVLPVIIGFVLLLSIIPAIYMSNKLTNLSGNDYKRFYTGKKKQTIVGGMVIAQFTISIGLLIASFTVNEQLSLIKQGGEHYQNRIEIGNWTIKSDNILPFSKELANIKNINNVCISSGSMLSYWIKQIILKKEDGSEAYYNEALYTGNSNFLRTMDIQLVKGIEAEEAVKKYPHPVFINEKFVELLVPPGEDPVGQSIKKYDTSFNKDSSAVNNIAGIVKNFHTNSLEEEIMPCTITIKEEDNASFDYIYIHIGSENKQETLTQIQTLWEKYNPDQYFTYQDMEQLFMKRNQKTIQLTNLLFMYSLISIFLTCFGLFGMALYATEQRTKEVGIRKINGATTTKIMLLLNRQFFIYTGIAFVIACPIAWYLLNRWLESFVYRTNIGIGSCFLSGGIVLGITLLTVSWHSYKVASGNPVDCLNKE